MKSSNPIRQLQCLNNVLAHTTGSDPYFSEQIERALRFQGRNHPTSFKEGYSIAKPAATLLQVHLKDKQHDIPFHHWHLDNIDMGPLWISAQLESILKLFTRKRSALLVITGLRTYICPNGKRWSNKAQKQYQELLSLLQKDAAKFTPPGTRLHFICL